jgi:WD40 repeat protein
LAVAPDGSWLASASHDTTVRIWDPATGIIRYTLTGHTRPVVALAVAPDDPGLPPRATTPRCGSGTLPPASSATPSPVIPAR